MSEIIVEKWHVPNKEDMNSHEEIKVIFFDDDEDGIQISPLQDSYIENKNLFKKYTAEGLVNCKERYSIKLYKEQRLIYGLVPLYYWDSENGTWVERKHLRKYCAV